VEEARVLANALAASAEAVAAEKKAEEAERRAALQAIAAFGGRTRSPPPATCSRSPPWIGPGEFSRGCILCSM
jgi:hypothetical protein